MALTDLRAALERGDDPESEAAWSLLGPDERTGAAPLALHLGRPALAARWARETGEVLTLAAAHLRLGHPRAAQEALRPLPETARPALLRARAAWQAGAPGATDLAVRARTLARAEGDAGALVATATLLGEMELAADPRAALRTLAEGLKAAELGAAEADPHLLAVLAYAQLAVGSRDKAGRTADKALSRSLPRSPARVVALLALGRREEAQAEATAGHLGEVWLRDFGAPLPPPRPL